MNWFFDSIDLSANIQRGLTAVRGVIGLPAYILGGALTLICVGLLPLVWFFDIDATLTAADSGINFIASSLPAQAAGAMSLVVLSLTLMPTLIELFGSRFAMANIRLAAALVYLFSAFDMITDWPRVRDFTASYQFAFNDLGFFATPVFFVFRLFFLFMASFGFEMLLVVFAVCALVLFINGGKRPMPRTTVEG